MGEVLVPPWDYAAGTIAKRHRLRLVRVEPSATQTISTFGAVNERGTIRRAMIKYSSASLSVVITHL